MQNDVASGPGRFAHLRRADVFGDEPGYGEIPEEREQAFGHGHEPLHGRELGSLSPDT